MESQSLSCCQSVSNATQGHLGNTKLYSATNRLFSIIEQIKDKTLQVQLLSAESHPSPTSQVFIMLHLLYFSFCWFFFQWWLLFAALNEKLFKLKTENRKEKTPEWSSRLSKSINTLLQISLLLLNRLFSYSSRCQHTGQLSWPQNSIYTADLQSSPSTKCEKKTESTDLNSLHCII